MNIDGSMSKKTRVAVLLGGTSAERDVSLRSGAAVARALRALGHDVMEIDAQRDLCERLGRARADVAFIALHGGFGEDGSVQGLLDVMGIPYTGSGVLASAMAMDKLVSKRMFEASGLKVPVYEVVFTPDALPSLQLPVVVKPSREGSSIGVSIVREPALMRKALEEALAYEGPALVEQYIKGKEVQIGVLGGRALGGVEVRPKKEFYDYEAKYTAGMTQYILPPELDARRYALAMDAGIKAHQAIGCKGATRVDLLIEDESMYVLEVNTIPGMTETSLLPKIAAMAGLDFQALIAEILNETLSTRRGVSLR